MVANRHDVGSAESGNVLVSETTQIGGAGHAMQLPLVTSYVPFGHVHKFGTDAPDIDVIFPFGQGIEVVAFSAQIEFLGQSVHVPFDP